MLRNNNPNIGVWPTNIEENKERNLHLQVFGSRFSVIRDTRIATYFSHKFQSLGDFEQRRFILRRFLTITWKRYFLQNNVFSDNIAPKAFLNV